MNISNHHSLLLHPPFLLKRSNEGEVSEDYTESEKNNRGANIPPSPLLAHSKFSDDEKKGQSLNDHSQIKRATCSSLARGRTEDLAFSSFAKRKNEFYLDHMSDKKLKKHRNPKDKAANTSAPTFRKVIPSRASISRPFKKPSEQEVNVLNDLAYFQAEQIPGNGTLVFKRIFELRQFARLLNKLKELGCKLPKWSVDEYSTFDIIWEISFGILIIWCLFAQLLQCGFGREISTYSPDVFSALRITNYIGFALFILDMLLKLERNFIKNSSFVKNRLTKAKRYLLSLSFPIDLVTTFSLLNQCEGESGFKFIFVLKFVDLRRIIIKLEKLFRDNPSLQLYFIVTKLSVYFFFITHIYCCLFNYLVLKSDERYIKQNYSSLITISNVSWQNTYLFCLYYTCSSILRVNFKSNIPSTSEEYFMANLLNFGSFVFLIKILFDIMSFFLTNLDENWCLRENIRILGHYMKRKKLNTKLKMKMWNHLEKISLKEKELDLPKEHDIISKMSSIIKAEVTYSEKFRILKNEPFFSKNFGMKTLAKITEAMMEKRAFPDEIVLTEALDNIALIFVTSGSIEVMTNTWKNGQQEIIATLKPEDIFGKHSLITNFPQQFVLKSKSFSTYYFLKREDFIAIVGSDSKEYEKFCVIRDSALLYNEYKRFYYKCYLCQESSHGERFCPKLIYSPPLSDLIPDTVLKKSRVQSRRPDFIRKRQNKQPSSLLGVKKLNESVLLKKINLGLRQAELQSLEIKTNPDHVSLMNESGDEKGKDSVTDENPEESEDVSKNTSVIRSRLNKEEYVEVALSELSETESLKGDEKKSKKEKVEKYEKYEKYEKFERFGKKKKEYDYRECNDEHYLDFEFYFPHNNISSLNLNSKAKFIKRSKGNSEAHVFHEADFHISCEDRYNSKLIVFSSKNNPLKSLLTMMMEQNLRQKSLLASRHKHKEADFSFSIFSGISNSQRAGPYQI